MKDSTPHIPQQRTSDVDQLPSNLILVSNRLPIQLEKQDQSWAIHPSQGGLVTALSGIKQNVNFSWVGWPGTNVADHDKVFVRTLLKDKFNYVPIFLDQEQIDHFYDGFCNSVLWPLFHYFPGRVDLDLPHWDEYKRANEHYAEIILPLCKPDTTVWIHDYHLFLLPQLLRNQREDINIGFFLHIPFPSSEIYRQLPVRKAILQGILGSDLVGFHTHDYARHFSSSCMRVLGTEATPTQIRYKDRKIKYGAYPIGINLDEFKNELSSRKIEQDRLALADKYKDCKIILGVDRIDYTKGLLIKLKAYEKFLERNPEMCGKVALIQVGIPSRMNIKEYQQGKNDLDQIIGRINGRFGSAQYSPIVYIARSISFRELCALYERADVLLVTSIRDGMNLVCLEYAACQHDKDGVIILSEFAGAAKSMGGAILINPWDEDQTATEILNAINMPQHERLSRARQNYFYINKFHSLAWAKNFVRDLLSRKIPSASIATDLMSDFIHLKRDFKKKANRCLFLDYDGTLVNFSNRPEDATPNARLLSMLEKLIHDPNNDIYLISGRCKDDLNKWFGHLDIGLAGEHGLFYREVGTKTWKQRYKVSMKWFFTVEQILKDHTQRVPGSFIERKNSSLVWHYRQADEKFGEWQALELCLHLDNILSNYPVSVLQGDKIIEIRPQGIDKGSFVSEILNGKSEESAFILCMGDDRTDEDMFAALPDHAWTCKIGKSIDTKANYFLTEPNQALLLLEELSEISLMMNKREQARIHS